MFPIKTSYSLPTSEGKFGAVRTHDIHTGIDIYCEEGTEIFAIEPGLVVAVCDFTGQAAGSPWWNDTRAVMAEGKSGVVLYGEIDPAVKVGDPLVEEALVGKVKKVLKKDKGKPCCMLHLECYTHGTRTPVWWFLEQEKPGSLINPEFLLKEKTHHVDNS